MSQTDDSSTSRIRAAYQDVLSRGLKASKGRPFEVVGVTKTLPVETVAAAYRAGLRNFGENYADELIAKASHPSLIFTDDPIRWHFIGAIQSRKIHKLADLVAVWHSVSREKEIELIAKLSPAVAVFIQVDFSENEQRNGVRLVEAAGLVNLCRERDLRVIGLMVVPPLVDPESLGKIFTEVNAERLRLGLQGCSMGMSDDFELALARGSTHIRVGTVLFGARNKTELLGSKIVQGGPE
ncbi:MAG: YggS family pyridoxal phosphate-dependent enzyme [Actinomycetota bacterium]|nr:YggS family pyridoxal phosphate-dependent enzyme [Actinomycetota bacterium]